LTTTTKLVPMFVYVYLSVCALARAAHAQAPADPESPPPAPPPAIAQPDASATPGAPAPEPEPPGEMTFGRDHSPASSPAPAPVPAAAPAPPPPPAPAPEASTRYTGRARTMEDVSGAALEELNIHNVRWRYTLNFFGDISLSATKPVADQPFGFGLGAQDLLIRGELSNSIIATTEIALEPGDEGVTVDVERFNVRWQSSRFFVEAGRTHTGIGYWNNAYHHGRWLQPTIARPRWVAFEDDSGILPVHWVGAGVGARLPVGAATLNLMATFGNGRGKIVDDVRNAHDYQAMKAFHASVELVGIGQPELRIGLAAIYDRIPPLVPDDPMLPSRGSINETIGSAHVAYVNVPLLLISEGYLVVHTSSGQQWTTYGGFALAGYTLGRVTPYVEVERIASSGGADPFFTTMDSASFDTISGIGGVRFDLSDWTAIKAEYRQVHAYDTSNTTYQGLLNWSWGF
jgi:hypothetical protein